MLCLPQWILTDLNIVGLQHRFDWTSNCSRLIPAVWHHAPYSYAWSYQVPGKLVACHPSVLPSYKYTSSVYLTSAPTQMLGESIHDLMRGGCFILRFYVPILPSLREEYLEVLCACHPYQQHSMALTGQSYGKPVVRKCPNKRHSHSWHAEGDDESQKLRNRLSIWVFFHATTMFMGFCHSTILQTQFSR